MLAESPFDNVAATYDVDFTNSRIGRLQRNRVWELLREDLPVNHTLSVLEMNCGTGEDALWLARQGHQVIATDISEDMLAYARRKTSETKGITFERAAFHNLHDRIGNRSFDLVFSNFGGLNCADIHELEALNEVLSGMVKSGGQLIIVLMGKYCLLERWYFRLSRKNSLVYRRLKAVEARLSGETTQPTWYYDSVQPKNIFSHFRLRSREACGIICAAIIPRALGTP